MKIRVTTPLGVLITECEWSEFAEANREGYSSEELGFAQHTLEIVGMASLPAHYGYVELEVVSCPAMTTDDDLPSSLAANPNIPLELQTLDELRAERAYWDRKANQADGWGAGVGVDIRFRNACDRWIRRREREAEKAARRASLDTLTAESEALGLYDIRPERDM